MPAYCRKQSCWLPQGMLLVKSVAPLLVLECGMESLFSGSLLLGTWPFLKELQTVCLLSFLDSMNRRYSKNMLGYIFDIVEGRRAYLIAKVE